MALVRTIEHATKDRQSIHGEVVCHFSRFQGPDGQWYLQLDTFGSDDRDFPGKISQSIQLNREGAGALLRLIQETFGPVTLG